MVTHGGTSTSRGGRGRFAVCREDARCFGREVVVVAVVVESSSRSAQLCHRVTHMHAHREDGEEKQTQRVTPVKKVVKNAPDMQVALPRCMNAMAIHCGAPITATRLSPIMYSNGDQLERAVSHTHGA